MKKTHFLGGSTDSKRNQEASLAKSGRAKMKDLENKAEELGTVRYVNKF